MSPRLLLELGRCFFCGIGVFVLFTLRCTVYLLYSPIWWVFISGLVISLKNDGSGFCHSSAVFLASIPLIITTLGILGASIRTCKPLYAYVLPHNIPVSRLENLYVYLTTTYYLYIMRLRIGNTHRPVTAILGCKYGAKSMGGSICSHNRNVTLPHRVNSTWCGA